ncbi:DUF1266 domain-containing protein [Halomonas sp. YLGW01]|uniref:DUF1266 domain-containing protein n=1 Tax=Halomonas sp. YLGW01 TaxID=2773308 RepID=UPI00177C7296|nr:DUF1266 domain-containing protein [Halomonas sp. YLGW01]
MVDPLSAWWAQQLVLCDWAFSPDPTAVEPALAVQRLADMEVADRCELGWRLIEAFSPGSVNPVGHLESLELLALAVAAGWLPAEQARAWVARIAADICAHCNSLEDWLTVLRQARSALGWERGEDGFLAACEALAALEREGAGITWDLLAETVRRLPQAPLWPSAPEAQAWRLRAAFAPALVSGAEEALDAPQSRAFLAEEWQVHDRDGLVRQLLWLAGQGDRYAWDLDAVRVLEAAGDAREAWLAGQKGETLATAKVLLGFVERGETLEWAAWDWLRLVDLAYAGLALGWLEADEAEAFAHHALDLITRRYSDWVAVATAYQRGRSLFEGRDRMGELHRDWALLLQSPASPWRLPLNALQDEASREASRRAMRGWRADPRHWVLALASVREPELLLRQGPVPTLSEAVRQEARHYLQEVLGLYPDDGVDGLARYWLPAQAHHLNQLAADADHGALPSLVTPFGQPGAEGLAQRDALRGCSRFSATVHMAEKYAFYLQMAGDSEDFVAEGLARLAESLRGVLCHFYPDARRLLNAWACWEAALPEPPLEQSTPVSLAHEIRWHRDDPGSPFHWLDWQISAGWQEPGPRLSLPRFTALALVGPLNGGAWSEPLPESDREVAAIREWIDGHYGLQEAEGLREFLDFLLSAGDRQEYQINYAPYTLNAARLASEIATLESDDCSEEERNHLLRLKRVRDNDASCNAFDMAAWDIAQAVDLAIAGRQLQWLSEAQFTAALDRAAALAASHYSSWQAYARGLYAGFSFFMGETEERGAFLKSFREAMVSWLTGAPPLAGPWASLDFPGARPRHWAPMHIDTLPGDARTLH